MNEQIIAIVKTWETQMSQLHDMEKGTYVYQFKSGITMGLEIALAELDAWDTFAQQPKEQYRDQYRNNQ